MFSSRHTLLDSNICSQVNNYSPYEGTNCFLFYSEDGGRVSFRKHLPVCVVSCCRASQHVRTAWKLISYLSTTSFKHNLLWNLTNVDKYSAIILITQTFCPFPSVSLLMQLSQSPYCSQTAYRRDCDVSLRHLQ